MISILANYQGKLFYKNVDPNISVHEFHILLIKWIKPDISRIRCPRTFPIVLFFDGKCVSTPDRMLDKLADLCKPDTNMFIVRDLKDIDILRHWFPTLHNNHC